MSVTKKMEQLFEVTFKGVSVAPFVWLETPLPGRFGENGFVYTEGMQMVQFHAWGDFSAKEIQQSLSIFSLYDRN